MGKANQGPAEILLNRYDDLCACILMLELELEAMDAPTVDDTIESMALAREPFGEHVCGGERSDRTSSVAMTYRDRVDHENAEAREVIGMQINRAKLELKRIDAALSVLPPMYRSILQGIFIEHKTGTILCDELLISPRSLYRYRLAALERMDKVLEMSARNPKCRII